MALFLSSEKSLLSPRKCVDFLTGRMIGNIIFSFLSTVFVFGFQCPVLRPRVDGERHCHACVDIAMPAYRGVMVRRRSCFHDVCPSSARALMLEDLVVDGVGGWRLVVLSRAFDGGVFEEQTLGPAWRDLSSRLGRSASSSAGLPWVKFRALYSRFCSVLSVWLRFMYQLSLKYETCATKKQRHVRLTWDCLHDYPRVRGVSALRSCARERYVGPSGLNLVVIDICHGISPWQYIGPWTRIDVLMGPFIMGLGMSTIHGRVHDPRLDYTSSAMKEGWISCRRVIGLFGCFLKSTCRGELLTAMGRDSNNQMFLIAWAVVSIENFENWLWFLSNLGSDFNLAMGVYLAFLSDGHKE
ncbi:putative integrase [Tanacetum coccineum]